jgi:hypothetical protein
LYALYRSLYSGAAAKYEIIHIRRQKGVSWPTHKKGGQMSKWGNDKKMRLPESSALCLVPKLLQHRFPPSPKKGNSMSSRIQLQKMKKKL